MDQFDLFAEPEPQPAEGSSEFRLTDCPDVAWCEGALDIAVKNSGQTTRYAKLGPDERLLLVDVIMVFSAHRYAAYTAAKRGYREPDAGIGWINAKPDLAAACALLNFNFIEWSAIPLWPDMSFSGATHA